MLTSFDDVFVSGCDVAFMSGKNCYGVQCFDEDLCTSIAATKKTPKSVLIAHVTFKGEKGNVCNRMIRFPNVLFNFI